MITDPPPTDSTIVPAPRKKLDSEFSEEENKLEMADTQAEIILSQGLPRQHLQQPHQKKHLAKEIWDNLEMLSAMIILQPPSKKTLKKQEASTIMLFHSICFTHTTAPVLPSPSTSSPQPTAQSSNDALMATMTQIANLLSGFQKQFPPTNNQLRTSSNSRTHATVHDGHIVTEPVQRKAPGNVGNTGFSRQEGDMLQLQRRRTCC
ncbi:hypothetical protein Tco_1400967 [Tanacetum coccineum]